MRLGATLLEYFAVSAQCLESYLRAVSRWNERAALAEQPMNVDSLVMWSSDGSVDRVFSLYL